MSARAVAVLLLVACGACRGGPLDDAVRLAESPSPDAGALAAARGELRAAWAPVYERLRRRPGPGFAQQLALAERLGRARAELDLLAAGPDAARATFDELARATSGSALGLAFERAAADLAWSGRRAPPLEALPLSEAAARATTAAAARAPVLPMAGTARVVYFHAGWDRASREGLGALRALCARHADVPALAVALDERERLPKLANELVRDTSPAGPVLLAAPDGWASNVAGAYGLRARGVPLFLIMRADGTVVRALEESTFIETWIRRAR